MVEVNRTPALLTALQTRLNLTEQGLADYLGIPRSTLRHWIAGTRQPGASALRLLRVMGAVEILAPDVHQHLLEETITVQSIALDPDDSDLVVDRLLAEEATLTNP